MSIHIHRILPLAGQQQYHYIPPIYMMSQRQSPIALRQSTATLAQRRSFRMAVGCISAPIITPNGDKDLGNDLYGELIAIIGLARITLTQHRIQTSSFPQPRRTNSPRAHHLHYHDVYDILHHPLYTIPVTTIRLPLGKLFLPML